MILFTLDSDIFTYISPGLDTGRPITLQACLQILFTLSKVNNIIKNEDHLLHHYHNFMRSGKRLRCISSRTQRFRKSFVPNSVVIFNSV